MRPMGCLLKRRICEAAPQSAVPWRPTRITQRACGVFCSWCTHLIHMRPKMISCLADIYILSEFLDFIRGAKTQAQPLRDFRL